MSNGERNSEAKPLWQQISGINPATEMNMGADARDAAIRKLVQEVEKRATVEFERGENGKIPEGERSVFWDPLARICLVLGISRTKLSSYSRELTGLRAHEISDRIRARRSLAKRLLQYVMTAIAPELEKIRLRLPPTGRLREQHRIETQMRLVEWMKLNRKGQLRARFAAELGFANPSRLSRACLLAHGMSIEEMEGNLVCNLVQKFFDGLLKTKDEPPRRQERQEQQEKEIGLTEEAQKIIDEAVAATVKETFKVAC